MNLPTYSKSLLLLWVCALGFFACDAPESRKSNPYSFMVAGHLYGNAFDHKPGIYPSFMQMLQNSKEAEAYEFGFALGDFIHESTQENWTQFQKDQKLFPFPLHLVRGNHEYRKDDGLLEKYTGTGYKSFTHSGDLFLILNSFKWKAGNHDEQVAFLRKELAEAFQFRNIFVFTHHFLWKDLEELSPRIKINSGEGFEKDSEFESIVLPMFSSLEKPVVWFAGDLGGAVWADNFSMHQVGNISFIGTGMGEGPGDNFVKIQVDQTGQIKVQAQFWNEQDRINIPIPVTKNATH